MIVDCISDLHGHYPKLEGGDLLIVAGDLTATHSTDELSEFLRWFNNQKYTKKILVGGNHDTFLEGPWPGGSKGPFREDKAFYDFDYLCDSGTEITYYPYLDPPNIQNQGIQYKRKTLKIWGSPWTLRFEGMNQHCMAFTCETEEELAEKWALIPSDIDILVTHSPPLYMLDGIEYDEWGISRFNAGSSSLANTVWNVNPKLHIFGHIHESYGIKYDNRTFRRDGKLFSHPISVNASHVNERYEPFNKPIRIEL